MSSRRSPWSVLIATVAAISGGAGVGCTARAQRSVALYESRDYAGAARAAEEGLAKHPADPDLWAMRVRAELAIGDSDQLAAAYEGYVARRGDDDRELLRELAGATLSQALGSPSAKLQLEAITAIEAAEMQPLADAVAQHLGAEDDRVAAAAAIAVLRAYPQAPKVANDLLHSENAEARRIVVDGLGRKVGRLVSHELEAAADDKDATVRAAALRWLGSFKDPGAVELCALHLRDHETSVRAAAASALAHIGLGDLAAFAKQALADHALAVRLAGVELVVAAERTDLLAQIAEDPDPVVALEAARAGHLIDAGKRAAERALAVEPWNDRAGAVNSLASALGKDDAARFAARFATDKVLGVRLAAARVLAHAGDPSAARALFEAALGDPERGVDAAADLAELGDPAGIAKLSALVRDRTRTPEQRAQAATAHRIAHRITPGLVAALADNSGVVRAAAASTIAALSR